MTEQQAMDIMQVIKADCYVISTDEDKEAFDVAIKSLKREGKYYKKFKRFKRKYLDCKKRIKGLEGACKQFMWERDIAIGQLKELGVEFGAKAENRCCDRDICLKNEYNGIGCEDCEVNK